MVFLQFVRATRIDHSVRSLITVRCVFGDNPLNEKRSGRAGWESERSYGTHRVRDVLVDLFRHVPAGGQNQTANDNKQKQNTLC